jgi:hypothetical protein
VKNNNRALHLDLAHVNKITRGEEAPPCKHGFSLCVFSFSQHNTHIFHI